MVFTSAYAVGNPIKGEERGDLHNNRRRKNAFPNDWRLPSAATEEVERRRLRQRVKNKQKKRKKSRGETTSVQTQGITPSGAHEQRRHEECFFWKLISSGGKAPGWIREGLSR